MNQAEFLEREKKIYKTIDYAKKSLAELEAKYTTELMARNGYKHGDVLTFEINGRTEKGAVYSVDRVRGNNSFYLKFKKIKKDGSMSLVDNDVMAHRDEFKLKQL